MKFGITGKKAFVMASSKGLGKSVALELAKEGCDIAICGRNEASLSATVDEIKSISDGQIISVSGDVSAREDRDRIMKEVLNHFGNVDILVTNSGGPPAGPFEDHNLDTWQNAYQLLLEGTVDMIQRVIPGMKENKWGRIVTISSQAIKQPVAGLVLSNSVRASLLGLVKTLSQELGQYNITVNNALPGYTKTDRLNNLLVTNPGIASAIDEIPLGRFAEVEEFAAAVAFLCSERASYISGVALPVDGGWIKGI